MPRNYPVIGPWVNNLRNAKKEGKLSKQRVSLLEKINFEWKPYEKEWEENYKLLAQHFEDQGNAQITLNHPLLGAWVGAQRRARKEGKISEERLNLLNKIGFVWDASWY